jgi:Zn-finger nucleic acid-binding protein
VITLVCPNCRERMSSVEHELGDVWSCLYCEGCWLSSREVQSLTKTSIPEGSEVVWRSVSTPIGASRPELFCSACETTSFTTRALNDVYVQQCTTCQGVFFEKGTLAALGTQTFHFNREAPQSVGQVIAASVATDIGVGILLSLFF